MAISIRNFSGELSTWIKNFGDNKDKNLPKIFFFYPSRPPNFIITSDNCDKTCFLSSETQASAPHPHPSSVGGRGGYTISILYHWYSISLVLYISNLTYNHFMFKYRFNDECTCALFIYINLMSIYLMIYNANIWH